MNNKKDFSEMFSKLDDFLTLYLIKKAPALPNNAKDIIVKYLPYITVVVLVLSLGPLLLALGLGTFLSPLLLTGGFSFIISVLIMVVSLALVVLAIPGLFTQKKASWNLLYYSALISALHSIVTLNLVGLIICTTISLYFLFQIKSYYK